MLRATQSGMYRNKNQRVVVTYVITGPAVEIAEYLATESIRRGIPVDQIAKTDKGLPIMFLPLDNELREGRTPQPTYDLVKNHDGTRFNRDTFKQDMVNYAKVEALTTVEMAKEMAQRRLGGSTPRVATPTTAPVATPIIIPAEANEADAIADAIDEGAHAHVAAGDETLAE